MNHRKAIYSDINDHFSLPIRELTLAKKEITQIKHTSALLFSSKF